MCVCSRCGSYKETSKDRTFSSEVSYVKLITSIYKNKNGEKQKLKILACTESYTLQFKNLVDNLKGEKLKSLREKKKNRTYGDMLE